jgi:hypothetical protein
VKAISRFIPSVKFSWTRAVGGYHWIDAEGSRRLVPVDENQPDWSFSADRYVTEYRPLEERSGLFWEFAALDPTENAIRQFADKVGLLGATPQPHFFPKQTAPRFQPESFQLWKREIEDLQQMVVAWRLVVSGDRKAMEKLKRKLSSPDAPLAVQRHLHVNEKDPAMFFLGAIQRATDPRLQHEVLTRLLFAGNRPRLNVVLEPQSLIAALWLQFAAAIDAGKSFAKCPQCGVPFEVSRDPSGKRRSARFCSDRCRVAHYRGRIDRAQKMEREGISLPRIARELNTRIATLRNWLADEHPA